MTITYGSVCSGIEAASIAWEPLGWKPAWFAQFDPEHNYARQPDFPSRVLAHHWPDVPNLGDMTQIADLIRWGAVAAPDVLVGGTPCQAFSVAGMRKGLKDPRGQLTISFGELADAIDEQRDTPCTIVWENVPGVLNSKDNAFGCFLALLAGESCELQPPGRKWTNAGCVSGPKRVVAWRVLDAQYFGVAQRRRRVFVIASADPNFDPTAILFESDSVRRDTPPSRETGSQVAALTANGVGTCGADDNQAQAGHLIAAFGGGNTTSQIDVATTCTAHGNRQDFDTETFGVCYEYYSHDYNHQRVLSEKGISPALTCSENHKYLIGMQVRRLMPVECERLQGFPDGHTDIPGAKDGPRYKALGNSMAVPVMRWIGKRISPH